MGPELQQRHFAKERRGPKNNEKCTGESWHLDAAPNEELHDLHRQPAIKHALRHSRVGHAAMKQNTELHGLLRPQSTVARHSPSRNHKVCRDPAL